MSSAAGAGAGAGAGAATDAATGEASFSTPSVFINSTSWGPTAMPAKYEHIAYAPFSKSDHLGRIADITGFTKHWHRACGCHVPDECVRVHAVRACL